MLCNITPRTQKLMRNNPDFLYNATESIGDNNNNILSHYFTLGRYDIIIIAQADSHIQAAKMSIDISNLTGLTIETLPTIIFNRLEEEGAEVPEDPQPAMSVPVYQIPPEDYDGFTIHNLLDIVDSNK